MTVDPFIYPNLPYDTQKDLTPVASLAIVRVFLLIHPSVPAKNFNEFVAYARANPGKLSYGSAGSGSSPHLAGRCSSARPASRRPTSRTRARRRRSTICSAGRCNSCSIPVPGCSTSRPAS